MLKPCIWHQQFLNKHNNLNGDTRVVPAPDGKIYLVDINETHYWGSLVRYMYWSQKFFSEKIETYQYLQKKEVHVLMGLFYFIFRFIGNKKAP